MHVYLIIPIFFLTFLSCENRKTENENIFFVSDSLASIKNDFLLLTIHPHIGGRVASLKFDSTEFLFTSDLHPLYYGSTFWFAPQSLWGWPPPKALEYEKYDLEKSGDTLVLTSSIDSASGFQVGKKIYIDKKSARISITYSLTNTSKKNIFSAPWEDSRMKKGGLVFFPKGKIPLKKEFTFDKIKTTDSLGCIWYKINKKDTVGVHKVITDGSEGWLAYVYEGKLFIKTFEDVLPEETAPGEGDVELYIINDLDFLEIEVQGKYKQYYPGERKDWIVNWHIIPLPENIKEGQVSKALLGFVRKAVAYDK